MGVDKDGNKLVEGMETEDPDFRFTYKLVYTYCVQSTGPLISGQLVEKCETGFEEALEEGLLDQTGCRTHVYLANIQGEETDGTAWSLF